MSAPIAVAACSDDGSTTVAPADDSKVDSTLVDSSVDVPDGATAETDDAATETFVEEDTNIPYDSRCSWSVVFDAGPDADVADDDSGDTTPPIELCRVGLLCGLPTALATDGCEVVVATPDGAIDRDAVVGCRVIEGAGCTADAVPFPDRELSMMCNCDLFSGGGRRVAGIASPPSCTGNSSLGTYLATMAHEEAASILAFDILARELASHGAPSELVDAAHRSRRDEIRHARALGTLARRHHATPPRVRHRRHRRPRSLESIARENAVEGCVHETFAAVLAHWQATHAEDPELRKTFARIAVDETRHAALGHAIADWMNERLDFAARRRVARARQRAVERLRMRLTNEPAKDLRDVAGLPDRDVARGLLDRVFGSV